MIRRYHDDNHWLLISQVAHARLAAELAEAWGNDRVQPLPLRDGLVSTIWHHDDGWRKWEREPTVEPVSGRPRDFTEMPMPVATGIWRESIAACGKGDFSHSAALLAFTQTLTPNNRSLTAGHCSVLEAVLSFRNGFTVDELASACRPNVSRATVFRAVPLLEQAGVVRRMARDAEHWFESEFEVTAPTLSSTPLSALWVSRHFCHLAEQARESRWDIPEDIDALERFLENQHTLQGKWSQQAALQLDDDELEPAVELGYRYLQAFDRMSLWLCTSAAIEPSDFIVAGAGNVKFVPGAPTRICVEPYPFRSDPLELEVVARRTPAESFRNDQEFQSVLRTADELTLRWRFTSR